MIDVPIANQQRHVAVDEDRLRRAVGRIVADAGYTEGEISVALVDDEAIARLHERYLGDPAPTDVISFVLEQDGGRLEGEVIVSGETAARVGPEYGLSPEDELLLYVVHGGLHLVGYDDQSDEAAAVMRRQERYYATGAT